MDRAAVIKCLSEIQTVLTDLSYSEQEVEVAVSLLGTTFYHCALYEVSGRNAAFSLGIVKALLGILRSSSNVTLLTKVASCLALLIHGNEEGREQLGRMGVVQILMNLLSPTVSVFESCLESSVKISWDLSRAGVYERALSVLRKLTYHNGDNQILVAQSGGVKLIVNIAMSDIFLRNSGHLGLESKQCLEHLTLGKKLACRAAFIPESCRGAVLSSFQALSGDNSVITAQYPAFYVSLATEEKTWISSMMIEMGVVWPDHTPFPADGSRWTRVVVTNVENGNNVWCQFCKERPDPRMKLMQESLDEMVSMLTLSSSSPARERERERPTSHF